ncbi:DUF4192 domain-containing protein [Nocardia goodfellowii]|uniref:DUF4192 domain-containing protein n=1 Tax=Nocardia goodfellowii TaxID=882446 RepID=A0ABS4QFQ1_9NOCA|nr:DUF4192 domain-containing protein [Nocardia goodfellowii]MBP2190408.1 hypothetical protein [Nocardia goodfellowii]
MTTSAELPSTLGHSAPNPYCATGLPRRRARTPLANCSDPSPFYRGGDWARSPLRIDDPGELIVALPPMLGFVPERSLVVAVLRAGLAPGISPVIDAVVRFDLEPPGGRRGMAARVAECLSRICAAEHAEEVLVVVVDDRMAEPGPREAHPRQVARAKSHTALVAALDKRLATHEVMLAGAWAVPAIDTGEHWWPLLGGPDGGVLPDPANSPVALASVLDGRPIHPSRTELTAVLAPEPELCRRVAAHLDGASERVRDRYVRAVRHGELDTYHRGLLEHVLWQIAHTASGTLPEAPEIAELVGALREPVVRGALYALAYTDHDAAAERLWVRMVRALPGPDRADAATLLGYGAYVRGDGPFAGVALDVALAADPAHNMAGLLESGLRSGMRPEPLRRVGRSGHAIAADLGIDLGPLVR